jgi:hypothetical protein
VWEDASLAQVSSETVVPRWLVCSSGGSSVHGLVTSQLKPRLALQQGVVVGRDNRMEQTSRRVSEAKVPE